MPTIPANPERTMDDKQLKKAYAALKKGMDVNVLEGLSGVLIDKDNATKTVQVKFTGEVRSPFTSGAKGPGWYPAWMVTQRLSNPLDQIHPMLAKNAKDFPKLTREEFLDSDEWGIEEKYDGERAVLRWDATLGFQATTRVVGKNSGRLGDNTGKLPHIAALGLGNTVLDMELFHKDGFQVLRSIMGSSDGQAIERQQELGFVYGIAFDCLWYRGRDLRDAPFRTRRQLLVDLFDTSDMAHLRLSPLALGRADKEALIQRVTDAGGEGVMVKRMSGLYTDTSKQGRRSADVLKVKPFDETDVIITGFAMGEGKYNQDKFGAIQIANVVDEQELTPELIRRRVAKGPPLLMQLVETLDAMGFVLVDMGSCAGMTQEQIAAFQADPDRFIGMPIEVSYQQRWPTTGLFRSANFRRLRDDKAPEDCLFVPFVPTPRSQGGVDPDA